MARWRDRINGNPLTASRAGAGSRLCGVLVMCGMLLGALALPAVPAWAEPRHGMALDGELKYPAGFSHFAYADPGAIKGGSLTLSTTAGFDTLNPFSLKGRAPFMLATLVFQSLTDQSMDEPFSEYGLIAQRMEVAVDGLSVTFYLNTAARFSDGEPVQADDVAFSFEVLRSPAANPFFRYYYGDIKAVEVVDAHTVRLRFAKRNRELAMIAGQVPVLPKHVYGKGDFGRDFQERAVGSGPYRVAAYEVGKFIRYARVKDHWAARLPVNTGRYNFDEIEVKVYRDPTVELEALKGGDFDFMLVNQSKQWAVDVAGDKWDKGYMVKERLRHHNNAGMQGFAFNLRKPIFADRRVRQALSLALDFEWSNRTLFYGQYTANDSYFANSELAATGLPSKAELALLEPLRDAVPRAVFTQPVQALGKGYRTFRDQLRHAQRQLHEAGWAIKDGVLTQTSTGTPMRFTVTLVSPGFERVVEPYLNNLRRLGVQADMRVVDDSIYERMLRSFDFDMVVHSIGQSLSPGNEQMEFWHSRAADVEGSRNVMGIKSPAVDALVEAIVKAEDRHALIVATHALDRVLWHEHTMVPHWYIDAYRLAYRNKFRRPEKLPLYYSPFTYLLFWWVDPALARGLQEAERAGRPFAGAR